MEKLVDSKRQRLLGETGSGGREERFERLARRAAALLRAPIAFVSLRDTQQRLVTSAVGVNESDSLTQALCEDVLASRATLVVSDVQTTNAVRAGESVAAQDIVAYAGVPVEVDGVPIGALCVADRIARQWTPDEVQLLSELALDVEEQIALRRANRALRERERVLDAVLSATPVGVAQRDLEGAVLRANPALERLLGRSENELVSKNLWALTHPDDLPRDAAQRAELLDGQRAVVAFAKRVKHADGHYVWVRYSAAALRDNDGSLLGTVAVFEDVSNERRAQEAAALQAQLYRIIANNVPRTALLFFDREFCIVAADGADLLATLGVAKSDLEGRSALETVPADERETVHEALAEALAGEQAQLQFSRANRTLFARLVPVWERESVTGALALIQDVTEEREQEQRLRRANGLFEVTLANVHDGVAVFDDNDCVVCANRAFGAIVELDPKAMVGMTRTELMRHASTLVEDPADFVKRMGNPRDPGTVTDDFVFVKPRRRHLRRTISPLALPDGPGYIASWHDVTAEAELLAEHERQAITDPLTGIANRRAAETELVKAKACAERAHTPLCVAFFDVDHFKRVNDAHGHATGDEVLTRVAQTLAHSKRLTDTVARWGGEEFIAVLPVGIGGAVTFCERVRVAIESLELPKVGPITISAGVAQLIDAEQLSDLLGRADRCLYDAKSSGRNCVRAENPARR
ncbi:MAG TPA: diguanylate cyclase [Polyangiaceae bacterium]|nr:diguanylate cyclase [Polyangiaceae bacterium]